VSVGYNDYRIFCCPRTGSTPLGCWILSAYCPPKEPPAGGLPGRTLYTESNLPVRYVEGDAPNGTFLTATNACYGGVDGANIVSVEKWEWANLEQIDWDGIALQEGVLADPVRRVNIVLVRDAFNWAASCLASNKTPLQTSLWKQHAREFLGETHHIPEPCVPVNFNRWFASARYRAAVADALALPTADNGLDVYWSPTSFKGPETPASPRDQHVFGRWKTRQRKAAFAGLFDDEMCRLSDEIFGIDWSADLGGEGGNS